MRLLVVEDEHSLREDIARKLRLSGYEVDACADGEAALEALAAERYDLVLLDLNLPKVDGMQVLRTLRRHDLETCVLILSARSEISDKVEGLDAGANDYLSKPFHLAELEARVRSLTRRKFIQQDVCLCCGRLSFNTRSRVAAVDGQTLALTRKESGVLEYLLLHTDDANGQTAAEKLQLIVRLKETNPPVDNHTEQYVIGPHQHSSHYY